MKTITYKSVVTDLWTLLIRYEESPEKNKKIQFKNKHQLNNYIKNLIYEKKNTN